MRTKGLTKRGGLAVVGMSASSLRYEPRPDRNAELRARIVALAQRHRRYGVGMIYLKLRQAGELVNYKRVKRLYRLEKLQISLSRSITRSCKRLSALPDHASLPHFAHSGTRMQALLKQRIAAYGRAVLPYPGL